MDIWKATKAAWGLLVGAAATALLVAGLQNEFNFSRQEGLTLFVIGLLVLLIIYVYGVNAKLKQLGNIERAITDGFAKLASSSKAPKPTDKANPGNPGIEKEEPEPEPKPSGGGAFGGMIVAAALGLPLGPPGVVIGGLIGAIVGNYLEYESLKKKERKS